jgi:hypothetical protein
LPLSKSSIGVDSAITLTKEWFNVPRPRLLFAFVRTEVSVLIMASTNSIMSSSLYKSSLFPMHSLILCMQSQMGSYRLCPSCLCISAAENPLRVAEIFRIMEYHVLNPSLEFSRRVPFFKLVLKPQSLHWYIHLLESQYCLAHRHLQQTTPCLSLSDLKCNLQLNSSGKISLNSISLITIMLHHHETKIATPSGNYCRKKNLLVVLRIIIIFFNQMAQSNNYD